MRAKNSLLVLLLVGLGGCSSIPINGPTRGQIEKSAQLPHGGLPIQLVQVENITDVPGSDANAAPFVAPVLSPPSPTDLVGPGDVLDISIYETGVALFSPGSGVVPPATTVGPPGVQAQRLPPVRVDDDGNIMLPYMGRLHVAGFTVREIEDFVRQGLLGMSQNPQVLISLSQAITNSVIVGGEVGQPGRLVLQTNKERLSDVIALAGGYRGETKDILARVFHNEQIIDVRLNDLVDYPSLDMRISPGDRVMLLNEPRTYSVLGAAGQVAQFPFNRSSVSLAEAIATAGGVSSSAGDPAAIFLFRYIRDEQGNETPIVYHLNMMKAGTYFLAQRFIIQDKDVLYFGNAAANRPGKLALLIGQLFTPLMTVTSAVRVIQDSN